MQNNIENVIKMEERENILGFYQKDLPMGKIEEKEFREKMKEMIISDEIMTDIEKLYKAHIESNKTPGLDY